MSVPRDSPDGPAVTGGRVKINARISPPVLRRPFPMALTECAGDGCPCRRGAAVHPPLLVTFSPEAGKYEEAWVRCSAIWAPESGHGYGHEPGRICGAQATHQVADVIVCEHHYRRIREWMNTRDQRDAAAAIEYAQRVHENKAELARKRAAEQRALDREASERRQALAREEARLQVELDRQRIIAEEAARAELSVVYFVRRDSDGLVKIGTSRGVTQRLAALKRSNGPLTLIATEGGAHRREAELHRQFAAFRAEGEWFRPELPLLEHVYALMKERPVEPAPGLPPVMTRKEIGRMVWKIKMEPLFERRRQEAETKEKRRIAREQREATAA